MGQKSNPISLRLEKTNQHWSCCWYGDYNYTRQFIEDCRFNVYIQNISQQTKKAPPVILLNRGRRQVQIALFSPRQRWRRRHPMRGAERPPELQGGSPPRGRGGGAATSTQRQHLFNLSTEGCNNYRGKIFRYLLLSLFATKLAYGGGVDAERAEKAISGDIRSAMISVAGIHWISRRGVESKWLGRTPAFPPHSPRGSESPHTPPAAPRGGVWGSLQPFLPKKRGGTPLKNHVEESCSAQLHYRCKVHLLKCLSPHLHPLFIASGVVSSLQERVPFRRLKHRLIREISENPTIKGVRITCSGRVAARSKKAQKARTESIQWGETSLHVFSELVHFASKSAQTAFGKIGVKVWICYVPPISASPCAVHA